MSVSFLSSYRLLTDQFSDPAKLAKAQAGMVAQWLGSNAKVLFNELRTEEPIFASPGTVIVTRHADVNEVLLRNDVFVESIYTPRMQRLSTDFFLGMPNTPQYEREVSIMRLAANRGDLSAIKKFVEHESKLAVDNATAGHIDLVADLSRLVPAHFIEWYLGVTGPDTKTLQSWMRVMFWDLFANLRNDSEVINNANQAAKALKDHLTESIQARAEDIKLGNTVPDDVLSRLLQIAGNTAFILDYDSIRRNLSGVAVGAVDTTSECVVNILLELFNRPEQFAAAKSAASSGESLDGFVRECLRFRPQHPLLYRVCAKETTIARGTERETSIPAGTVVLSAVLSAMFDDTVVDSPETFMLDRPSNDYLLFGKGQHVCFGAHINMVQIPEICRSVLRLPGLRPAEGESGEVQYDGPFPDHWILEFDSMPVES